MHGTHGCVEDVSESTICACRRTDAELANDAKLAALDAAVIEAAVALHAADMAYAAAPLSSDWTPLLDRCVKTKDALTRAVCAWNTARKEAQ
jgi:hypothetical protein